LSFVWNLVKPFAAPLAAIAAAAAVFTLMSLWDRWVDDPAVTRAARLDYVALSEKTALETQLRIERQMRANAQAAVADYAMKLDAVFKAEAATREKTEQEIAEYEAKLKDTRRSCELSADDIEWLRKP
jgi:hypothetical protein